MTKLRLVKIAAFRGARFELPLDFGKNNKSLAIFGENAAGKSTITDALEWFIHDRVGHLWREDCRQEALRHVLAKDEDDCRVEVRFDGKDQDGGKSLSAGWCQTNANQSPNAPIWRPSGRQLTPLC